MTLAFTYNSSVLPGTDPEAHSHVEAHSVVFFAQRLLLVNLPGQSQRCFNLKHWASPIGQRVVDVGFTVFTAGRAGKQNMFIYLCFSRWPSTCWISCLLPLRYHFLHKVGSLLPVHVNETIWGVEQQPEMGFLPSRHVITVAVNWC